MNKFTLLLQDKEVIKELACDPEIQIKIKNSIVDEVKRRASKGIDSISEDFTIALKEELFEKTGYYSTPRLKPAIKKLLEKNIEDIVTESVLDKKLEIARTISESMDEYKAAIRLHLSEIDINQILREEAAKIIERKFR